MPPTTSRKLTPTQLVLAFVALFALFFISRSQNILWGDIFCLRGNEFDSYRDTATAYSFIGWNHLYPLYYRLTQMLIGLFGYSDTVIRLVPWTATMISLPVFCLMLRNRYSDATALSFAILLLFSPIHLLYSANARAYSLAFLLLGIFFLTLSDYFMKGRLTQRQIFILSLSGIGATISHNSAIIPLGAALVFFTGHAILNKKLPAKTLAILAAVFCALGAIAFSILARHLTDADIDLIRPLKVWAGVINEIEFPLFVLVVGYGGFLAVSRRRRDLFFLFSVIIISFAAVFAIGTLDPKIANRYLYTSLPPFFFIGAICIGEISQRFPTAPEHWLVTIVLAGLIGAANLLELADFYRDGDRYNYKAAIDWVEKRAAPNDLLLGPNVPGIPQLPRINLYTSGKIATTVFVKSLTRIEDETFTAIPDHIDLQRMCLPNGNLWFITREDTNLCPPGDNTLFCQIATKTASIGIQRFDHHRWMLDIYTTTLPACR